VTLNRDTGSQISDDLRLFIYWLIVLKL